MIIDFTERFDIPSGTAQTRGHGANGRTWKSPFHRIAAATWQALFERHRPKRPLTGPVAVSAILMYHRRDVGAFARPKTTRPDWDNLAKVFDDALMAAGIIAEDACIWDGHVTKMEWEADEMVRFRIENDENDTEKPEKSAENIGKQPKNTRKRKGDANGVR